MTNKQIIHPLNFINQRGEMANLIRNKDWSLTPVGMPEYWPQSLRTTLSIILNSKFPMFLFWGSELICFYNDAYRPSLGNNGKHPAILGGRAEDFWKEIWSDIKPIIDNVLKGGEANWSEDQLLPIYRNGKMEDVYWTFSYSPVNDESGSPAGVFVTCVETTDKVLGIKKLKESDSFNLTVLESSPDCIKLLDKEGHIQYMNINGLCAMEIDDFTFIKNKPWAALWGKENQYLVEETIAKALQGQTATFNAFCPTVKGTPKWWEVKLSPVRESVSNKIISLISVSRDITADKKAEEKLKESEERLHLAMGTSGVGIWEWNLETNQIRWDKQMFRIYGLTPTSDGYIPYEAWSKAVDPEDILEQEKILQDTVKNKKNSRRSFKIIRANDGKFCYIEAVETVRTNAEGNAEWVIGTNMDVTERKVREQQLQKTTSHLDLSTKSAGVGTWLLHIRTEKLEWSALHKRMWGYDENETDLGYEDWHRVIHIDDKERCFAEVATARIEKRKYEVDYRIHRANDGELRWVKSVGQYHFNDAGEAVTLTGISIDITNAKIAEEELKASEENFRQLSDLMPEKVSRSDSRGNVIYFNQSWLNYTGMSCEDLKDWSWGQVMHPDDIEELTKLWTHSVTTGDDFEMEFRILNKEGQYRWHLCRSSALKDEQGLIKNWVGVTIDIEQQKKFAGELEMEVKSRTTQLLLLNEDLKKSEERYHLMVGEVQDYAILYLSNEGIIENWNKGAERITGFSADEIIGKSFKIFYPSDALQSHLPEKLIEEAITTGTAKHEGWRVRKDGTRFWGSIVITALHDEQKNIIGFSKVTRDLTAIKEADDKIKMDALQLKKQNEELEKMNKELESFAYIASHDLQEPLRKIQTYSSFILAKEVPNLTDSGKNYFSRIQNAAKRMQQLIDDILSYSRTNHKEVEFELIDLNKLIAEVTGDLKDEMQNKNAIIETKQLCTIKVIPYQFRQLFQNLISNSLKFSKPDYQSHIIIMAQMVNSKTDSQYPLPIGKDYCHITVSDNGIGFDQQYSHRIFELFQRLHGKNEYNGTGIGLAIVKKIVENHKGLITATSTEGKGANFNIYIPVES